MPEPVEVREPQVHPDLGAQRERAQRRAVAAEWAWYVTLGVIAVLMLLSAVVVIAASQPATCALCHGDTRRSLANGAHAKVACEVCHSGSTAVGVLQARLSVVNMVVSTVVPRAIPVESDVPSQRCLECHEKDMEGTVVANGLKMSHRAPLEAGWECRSCHSAAGHAVESVSHGYTMDMCLSCHTTNPGNLATCDICHAEDTDSGDSVASRSPWSITHGPNARKTHGMGDLDTCRGCHPQGYCVRCHGANVPHPARYLPDHGKDVLARPDGSTSFP
jgi:hypothetical protein